MSAQEFAEWQVVFRKEQLHPQADRLRHAQLLAATLTGAVKRRDRKPWGGSDFMEPDVWKVAPEPAPVVRNGKGGEASRMKALFGRKGRKQ